MLRSIVVRYALAWAGSAAVFSIPGAVGRSEDPTKVAYSKEDIERVWSRRQDTFRAARFTWKEERLTAKGTLPGFVGDGPFPPADVVHWHDNELLLADGDKIRYTRTGPIWIADRSEFDECRYLSVFDGKVSACEYSGPAYEKRAAGFVGAVFPDRESGRLWPMLFFCRPLAIGLGGISLKDWELLPGVQEAEGEKCVVLRQNHGNWLSHQIFLSVEREYLPVKILRTSNAAVVNQFIIRYRKDAAWEPIPDSWEFTVLELDGSLNSISEGRLESFAADQAVKLRPKAFTYEPGPRTLVQDERDGSIIVIRHDGSRKKYSKSDWENGRIPPGGFDVDPVPGRE